MKDTRPYFIVCAYEPCGLVKQVRSRYYAVVRPQRHCSHACATAATAATRREKCREACRRVGLARAREQRRLVLKKIHGLSRLQAFKKGYKIGLYSKLRQIRKKFVLVPVAEWQRQQQRGKR